MGLLSVVRMPREAAARAANAVDVVNQTVVTETLHEAIAGCGLVIGTSARQRTMRWTTLSPRESAERAIEQAVQQPVAIVFGRERTGLTNDELALCHYLVHIPTDPDYSSLNVASAVQVLSYEIYTAWQQSDDTPLDVITGDDQPITADQMHDFFQHLRQTLDDIEFFGSSHPQKLMRRLQIFFNRAHPSQREMNILRGILTAVQRKGS